ncbi:glycoside hydrolase family 43 protein [Foetidibacter luteolus]|uniref:glycoside hydrolase family 43 protein n=1 Tax=Foetidibacter luteolus TaxID=2608880 RepID=UPI00129A5CD8|nr:glycoside hydrolase family 43 protein [Foetidibacter luteolus]
MNYPGNPIIRHKYTADPTALVYNDKIYLYTGHDEAPVGTEEYVMNDWLCFSSADLVTWEEHPGLLQATDFAWAAGGAYATNVIEKDSMFYWFTAVNHQTVSGTAIGVARSSSPTGKFEDVIGAALITRDMLPATGNPKINLDPSVIVDDDGCAYIFWGNGQCHYAKLTDNMVGLGSRINTVDLPDFEEGAHIHKRNGWYYLSYGYGMPEKVAYAMSRSIHGPWEFMGILNEIAGNCETNRPCIVDFRGKSYFFYHNGGLKNGGSHRRSVCVDELYYNTDASMKRVVMTSEGVSM